MNDSPVDTRNFLLITEHKTGICNGSNDSVTLFNFMLTDENNWEVTEMCFLIANYPV